MNDLQAEVATADRATRVDRNTVAILREALAYAQSIVDTVREPMIVVDGTVRIQTASRAFYGVFGVSREDTEGQFIYELGNGQWNIPALRMLLEDVMKDGEDFRDFEVTHDFPHLGRRMMLINARKLWTNENDSLLALMGIEDVTERKRLHAETGALAALTVELRSEPFSTSRRRTEEILDEQEREMLRNSIAILERLKDLMEDILTFSEMGNAPQQRRLISLDGPLQLALANLKHHIEHNAATITIGSLPEVWGDRTQMVMVFQNHIGNALKYRRAEAPHIRIEAVQEGSDWRISVADNGEGVRSRPRVCDLQPFKRLHGNDTKGSGIGPPVSGS